VEESGVDEPELGKLELDKLEVGFDHVKLLGRIDYGCLVVGKNYLDRILQHIRSEIQMKGVIDESIHFDALAFSAAISLSKEEVIELDDSLRWAEVSQSLCSIDGITMSQSQTVIKAIGAIGPPRPFNDGCYNSSIVWRSGIGRSPGPSAAISELFKRVRSERDLLRKVSSGLSRGGKRFLAVERVLMYQK
nr:hypothetical protein [Tanacetum cinerariifolium]